jgi:hypothetical protein
MNGSDKGKLWMGVFQWWLNSPGICKTGGQPVAAPAPPDPFCLLASGCIIGRTYKFDFRSVSIRILRRWPLRLLLSFALSMLLLYLDSLH